MTKILETIEMNVPIGEMNVPIGPVSATAVQAALAVTTMLPLIAVTVR